MAFLARLRALDPLAKRLLLTTPGRGTDGPIVQRAAALGHVDHYVAKPRARRDEAFHALIIDFLRSWGRDEPDRFAMVQIVEERWDRRSLELRDLLDRTSIPVAVMIDGTVLVDPGRAEIAEQYKVPSAPREVVDLAIVGAGPAGLAAAVYGTSEGLDTLLIERAAMGGQAGTSSRIRNYLGFPQGVLGADLAQRAVDQAWTLGTRYVFLQDVTELGAEQGVHRLRLSGGQMVRARAVLLAGGADYRRLGLAALEELVGPTSSTGPAASEASAMEGAAVYVAGGGNSTGQAAVHLARYAKEVTLLIRGRDLAASMSEYLINEIAQVDTISVRLRTEIVAGGGTGRLQWLRLRDRTTDRTEEVATFGLFVLIGAVPHTGWLPDSVLLDPQGYVLTGVDLPDTGWRPLPLETSVPGVFAAGDIRSRSMKRVASAVGEGATVVAHIHRYLTEQRPG